MRVLKKNGTVETFSSTKAKKSIKLAMKASSGQYFPHLINAIVAELEDYVQKQDDPIDHAKIDKFILGRLKDYGQGATASTFERYKTLKYYKQIGRAHV